MDVLYTDEEAIEKIRHGGGEEKRCLEFLYHSNLPSITNFVMANNGTEADAKDVFQDALVIFYEQVRRGTYTRTAKVSTYLYAIVKHLWLNQLKKKGREFDYRNSNDDNVEIQTPLFNVLENEKQRSIELLIGTLQEDCKKILKYSIYENLPMREISEKMGYKNEQVARNKKYKCISYLKDLIKESPVLRRMIKELK